MWFKKRIAALRRFLQYLCHMHRMIDAGHGIIVLGIMIFTRKQHIGCECGEVWYSTIEGSTIVNEMNKK